MAWISIQGLLLLQYRIVALKAHLAVRWFQQWHIVPEKYQKYLKNCNQYKHNVLKQLYEYDRCTSLEKIEIYFRLLYAKAMAFIYRIVFKMKERK